MSNKDKQLEAVALIDECGMKVQELLSGVPVLAGAAKHQLARLSNQIRQAAGIAMRGATAAREREPLTHILGKRIEGNKSKPAPAPVDIAGHLAKLEFLGKQVIEDVKAGVLPTDILSKHEEPAILAAAAMVGLDVTGTDKANARLIADIYNKIEEDAEREEQDRKAQEAAVVNGPVEEKKEETEEVVDVSTDRVGKYYNLRTAQKDAEDMVNAAHAAKANLPKNATAFQKGEATRKVNEATAALEAADAALKAHVETMSDEEYAIATTDQQ